MVLRVSRRLYAVVLFVETYYGFVLEASKVSVMGEFFLGAP